MTDLIKPAVWWRPEVIISNSTTRSWYQILKITGRKGWEAGQERLQRPDPTDTCSPWYGFSPLVYKTKVLSGVTETGGGGMLEQKHHILEKF